MTIEKGAPWGWETDEAPARVAADDAELAALAAAAGGTDGADGADGPEPPRLSVRSGDVLRTLGLSGHDGTVPRRDQPLAHPFDLGTLQLDDGRRVPFVAHAVARRRWWSGPFAVVCNVGWVGSWYVGPRAHPNDGLLDVVHGSLPLRQRLEARRRVKTGTHLPHPGLRTQRVAAWETRFDQPVRVWADGVPVGLTRGFRVEVRPDALVVIV